MAPSAVTDIFADEGAPQLEVAAPGTATQTGRDTFTLGDPSPSGGVSGYTYAWTWLRQPGTATFSNAAIAQPTVTPDAEGEWVAQCVVTDSASTTIEYTYTVRVGLEIAAGVFGQVLFDIDYVVEGAAGVVDLVGGGDFVIDGVTHHCSVSGVPTTFKLNAHGIEMTDDAGAGTHFTRFGFDPETDFSVADGDTLYFEIAARVVATNTNEDRIQAGFMQSETGLGTDYAYAAAVRFGAADLGWMGKTGVGVTDQGQLTTTTSGQDVRIAVTGSNMTWDAHVDTDTALTDPLSITRRRGLRNSDSQANADQAGTYGPPASPWYANVMACFKDSNASFYVTRARLTVVRARAS